MAPGAWVIGVQGLRHRGLHRVRLRRGRRAGDPRRRRRDQLLDLGWHQPVHRPGRAGLPRRLRRRRVRRRLGRQRGPGAGTANHLSPWVTTVAASTQTREFATTLTVTAGQRRHVHRRRRVDHRRRDRPAARGAGPGRRRYTDAAVRRAGRRPASSTARSSPASAAARPGSGRASTSSRAGARAWSSTTRRWPTSRPTTTGCPTVHLADGTEFLAFMNGHTGETASFAAGETRDGQGDVMAAFSSRGPAGCSSSPTSPRPACRSWPAHTPIPRPTRRRRRSARRVLPGDRRHVDVVAARGRRGHPAQGRSTRLDPGADQVGADDDGDHRRPQGGPRHAGRSVRLRRRAHRHRRRRRPRR